MSEAFCPLLVKVSLFIIGGHWVSWSSKNHFKKLQEIFIKSSLPKKLHKSFSHRKSNENPPRFRRKNKCTAWLDEKRRKELIFFWTLFIRFPFGLRRNAQREHDYLISHSHNLRILSECEWASERNGGKIRVELIILINVENVGCAEHV